MGKKSRKWTEEEDKVLIKTLEKYPTNIKRALCLVATEIDRTPGACGSRWYTVVSKRKDCKLFLTASSSHVSINRKNGMGIASKKSIWQRILKVVSSIIE